MTFRFAADEHAFRAQTDRQRQMAGVTSPSFMCPACRTCRAIAGRIRVQHAPRGRYVCRQCAEQGRG